jgi:hypothetical protein
MASFLGMFSAVRTMFCITSQEKNLLLGSHQMSGAGNFVMDTWIWQSYVDFTENFPLASHFQIISSFDLLAELMRVP